MTHVSKQTFKTEEYVQQCLFEEFANTFTQDSRNNCRKLTDAEKEEYEKLVAGARQMELRLYI